VAGVAWSLLTVGLSSVLALSVFLITSRVLTPADFGAVALAVAVVSMVSMLVPVAFGEALIQRADLRRRHLDSVFWLTFAMAGVLLWAWSCSAPLRGWMELDVLAAILPALGLRIVFDALATVPARSSRGGCSSATPRCGRFWPMRWRPGCASGWCWRASRSGRWSCRRSPTASWRWWYPSWPHAGGRGGTSPKTALSDLGFFGLYAMGGRILNQARLDHFVLGVVLGPATLGLYYFANRLFLMLGDLTSGVFGPVTGALMASLQAEHDKRREAFQLAISPPPGWHFPSSAG
jgi:teichuronic acid exporter